MEKAEKILTCLNDIKILLQSIHRYQKIQMMTDPYIRIKDDRVYHLTKDGTMWDVETGEMRLPEHKPDCSECG